MAQYVLINPVGTRFAGEVLDSVQDGQAVIDQLVAFGGVLVPLPNALLQPYIDRAQQLVRVGNYDEATAMMQAAYASSTAISGGGTTGTIPIWSSASGLGDSAITEVSGAIQTLTLTNAGAGATNGTYTQQALTGGTGSGATADIVVSGNVVTVLALRSPGTSYTVGNTLSCATIGGAGFVFTVSAVSASDNASGNVTGKRFGAGTTTPRGAFDLASGAFYATSQDLIIRPSSSAGTFTTIYASVYAGATEQITKNYPGFAFSAAPRIDVSLQPSATHGGYGSIPQITGSTAAQALTTYGYQATVYRAQPLDVSTGTTNVYGYYAQCGIIAGVGAASTSSVFGFASVPFISAVGHTIASFSNFHVTTPNFSVASTITNYYGFRQQPHTGSGTITNRWGVSIEDAATKSAFYGNLGVGNALDVGVGKVIASLTLTNAGAGATNGTYIEAALTGGTGTGATADIVVAGNVVTTLLLRNPGQGYTAGDTLSTAAIGGAGFVFTVATTASILRSDGTAVASRVGAGTTSPRLSLDAVNGAMITGSASMIETNYYTSYFNSNIGAFVGGTVTPSTIYRGVFVNPLINTTSMALTTAAGLIANPNFTDSTAGSITNLTGLSSLMYRSYPNDLSTGANLTGVQSILGTRAGVGSVTSGSFTFFTGNLFHTVAGHTITTLTWYDTAATTLTGNVTTTYLLRGRAFAGAGTITNRWAISQEDSFAKSAFYGNLGVGNALDVGAGKVIGSLTLTAGGTLYTNGTYSQVALTGGTGTGATADIVISGNAVTTVILRASGQGYVVGDVLSVAAASVGGTGSGFQTTVGTVASILRSDGQVVAPRVGAGTTTPRSAMDVSGGIYVTGAEQISATSGILAGQLISYSALRIGGTSAYTLPAAGASGYNGIVHTQSVDVSASSFPFMRAGYIIATLSASGAGQAAGTVGTFFGSVRSQAADLATNYTGQALSFNASVFSGTGSATSAELSGVTGFVNNLMAGHTVTLGQGLGVQFQATGNFTTLYGVRLQPVTAAGTVTTFYGLRIEASTAPTITNRWGISQEDAVANNVLAGKTAAGQAAGTTATALVDVGAATTTTASLRIRSSAGTAPTAPNDGDIWFDGTNLKIRIGGVTKTFTVV